MNQFSGSPGKEGKKFKLKRGAAKVQVKNKVVWQQEAILGEASKQRLNYDHLSITQWVQGLCRNVLDKKCNKRREVMISYLGDIMEDATDFSWSSAKASHAVLHTDTYNTDGIERIRRVHVAKACGSAENV